MRVTSVQLDIADEPKDRTVGRVLARLDEVPAADLILLPEVWPSGYFSFDRYRAESEPLDGPTVEAFRRQAARRQCHILMGSLIERQGEQLFNTSVLLDGRGEIVATYRKIHLFGYQSRESQLLQRGADVTVAATPWGRVGLTTCYDLRFPELYRRMVDRGAEIFLVVSAWPAARLEAWRLFNRARAHENLAYLISCNCAGSNGGARYAGHSMVVDPWGKVLAEGGEEGCLVSAEIDPAAVEAARNEFPALADRVFREDPSPAC